MSFSNVERWSKGLMLIRRLIRILIRSSQWNLLSRGKNRGFSTWFALSSWISSSSSIPHRAPIEFSVSFFKRSIVRILRLGSALNRALQIRSFEMLSMWNFFIDVLLCNFRLSHPIELSASSTSRVNCASIGILKISFSTSTPNHSSIRNVSNESIWNESW